MVRLNSSIEQLKRLSGYCFPNEYASLFPKGFKIQNLFPQNHYEALCTILKKNHKAYGITGGRGSAKSSLLATLGMLFAMHKDGDVAVVCKTVEQCRFSMDYLSWIIEKTGTGKEWKRYLFQFVFVYGENTKKERKVRFVYENNEVKIRQLMADRNTKFILVECAEDIDFDVVEFLFRNSVVPRTLIATFHIREAGFFDTRFYDFIKDYPIFRFTCFDVPHEYLGERFYTDAETFKKIKPRAYIREYLGTLPDKANRPLKLSNLLNLFKFSK